MPANIEYRWTEDEDTKLKTLWESGNSASEIARLMGKKSRSAVLGRVHRLKLPLRTKLSSQSRNRAEVGRLIGSVKRIRKAMTTQPLRQVLRDLPTEPLPPVDTTPAKVSFNDLENHHCRAIVAEHMPFNADAKIYCGERKVPGTSWCECHLRRYATPIETKRAYRPNRHYSPMLPSSRIKGTAAANAGEFLTETT